MKVESPCIGVCTLDANGLCEGCQRRSDEIAGWLSMTDDERQAVVDDLPRRRESVS